MPVSKQNRVLHDPKARTLARMLDVPFAIAGVMLAGASVAAFSIKERKYSARYQVTEASQAPLPHAG